MYNSTLVERFVNSMMWDGKKSVAQRAFYTALEKIQERTGDDPLKLFKKAVENCKPVLEVKTRRVGGANYQVPIEIRPRRQETLAMRWLIQYSRDRKTERTMRERLAMELLDAADNKGASVKKKEDTHRMAEANKAFAHYRW
mgnify:CR=1 FL=1